MCGRFTITEDKVKIEKRFNATMSFDDYKPRYNAAPSQFLPIIKNIKPKKITPAKWGLIPFWIKEPKPSDGIINARAETITEKPSFKKPFEKNRCLVVANSFFEWKRTPGIKIPYRIMLKNEEPFAFAGIYEVRQNIRGVKYTTFSIITTDANPLVCQIHNRMPVILYPDYEDHWLNDDISNILELLKPFPANEMKVYPVATLINKPKNDFPKILEPIE